MTTMTNERFFIDTVFIQALINKKDQYHHQARELFKRALKLYHSRLDKTWGLCDCISFIVMWDNNLTDAVTADQHFHRAGFNILM
jgi:hypothetical protein